jgi:hypothetical protein
MVRPWLEDRERPLMEAKQKSDNGPTSQLLLHFRYSAYCLKIERDESIT